MMHTYAIYECHVYHYSMHQTCMYINDIIDFNTYNFPLYKLQDISPAIYTKILELKHKLR